MKKVYVLQNSWHTDCEGSDFGIVGIFVSRERAIEELKKCVADDIANDSLFENGEPCDGTVVEDDIEKGYWCAYEDGEYLLNSCEYKITEEVIYE